MTIDDWFTWAAADAERRGLPALIPLLDGLRKATRELRDADWNDDAGAASVADAPTSDVPASGGGARPLATESSASSGSSAS
jgi:hypothetical protein